jgi:hypothetical protein
MIYLAGTFIVEGFLRIFPTKRRHRSDLRSPLSLE